MKRRYKLAASLICSDPIRMEFDIDQLIKGQIDYIHFDVMDGNFVPRFGLYPEIITKLREKTDIPLDLHMMVEDAEYYIDTFVQAGANNPNDIYVIHVESTRHLDRVIRNIHKKGLKAGVALNPATSFEAIKYVLNELDLIMLMAINPGIVGHKLIPSMLDKIVDCKNLIGNRDIIIEVDGGVNIESAPKMIESGASMLVCGTQTIFRPHEASIDEKIKDLRKILDQAI